MTVLSVRHITVYRYRRPVSFGEHRLMFRPRDSHDLRLLDTSLSISPKAEIRWLHDVFSNSIAIASFSEPAETLRFDSRITIDHFGLRNPDFPVAEHARHFPFTYDSDELADLGRTIERHYPDPERRLDAWAREFLIKGKATETRDLLVRMTRAIRDQIAYERRLAVGIRSPVETLTLGSGSCRDLALLMMEAVRSLGLAARFVSGYLYDPALENGEATTSLSDFRTEGDLRGGGATHAWVQTFLPGAGWIELDPTNGLVGGANLIRVAVARDPTQALPLSGTYLGAPDDFIEMTVDVRVTAVETTPQPAGLAGG